MRSPGRHDVLVDKREEAGYGDVCGLWFVGGKLALYASLLALPMVPERE